MATYKINALYEYEAEIEADSPEQAEAMFLADFNSYYVGTDSFDIEELEEEE